MLRYQGSSLHRLGCNIYQQAHYFKIHIFYSVFNPFSTKPIFAEKKKVFYELLLAEKFYAREINLETFVLAK